jgi:propionyl-CoA carboxylase alpha chain
MKMEHAIRAPAAGVVADLPVAVGAQVDSGSVLAVLEDADDAADADEGGTGD